MFVNESYRLYVCNMASLPPSTSIFEDVLADFSLNWTVEEKTQFAATTLSDLEATMERIQRRMISLRKQRGMRKLEGFLEAMKEFDKVIQVFVNSSEILAFVWGPMKFLLQTVCHVTEAFDAILNTYQRIGEQIPLLTQRESQFRNNPHMRKVLGHMYRDILEFHWTAMKYFKRPALKLCFSSVWKTFNRDFEEILRNLREHRTLIESQASIEQTEKITEGLKIHEKSFKTQSDWENKWRREFCIQWLSSAPCAVDQETHARTRSSGTGRWLLQNQKFLAWFDQNAPLYHLLWLTGIPGAGKLVGKLQHYHHTASLRHRKINVGIVCCGRSAKTSRRHRSIFLLQIR